MRGIGSQHHIHVTHKADAAKFIGATFEVSSKEDLEELAQFDGSSNVQASTEIGGGFEVIMMMPDGFQIKASWGRDKMQVLPSRNAHKFNNIDQKDRVNHSVRIQRQACDAIRLGHFVLHVTNHDESVKWLFDRFNFLPSDYFVPPGEEDPIVGTFIRLNLGEQLVDHHFLLVLQSVGVGVHHCSFEVADLDAVMSSHEFLLKKGYQLDVGVGRHMLGSQIYDYWKDPFGFRVEHYTDGDTVNSDFKPSKFNGTACDTTQWGMEPPIEFFQ